MDLSSLYFFAPTEMELLHTWSDKTNRWIIENFVLLGSLWSDLPNHLKKHLSRFTQILVDALKSLSLAQSPEAILGSLGKLLENLEAKSSLAPSIIVGFSIVNGNISSDGNIEFPVLQLLASKILAWSFTVDTSVLDGYFHRLLNLLSPKLTVFTFQLIPREVCKRIHLPKIKAALEENLRIMRNADLRNGFVRAVFVEWTRISHWFAATGLVESILDYFATGFEFLVRVSCGSSRSANLSFRFLSLPLYNALRMAHLELHESTHLPISQVYQGDLEEIMNVSQSIASAFGEPKLTPTIVRLSNDFLLHCAYLTNLSAHRLSELLHLSYPMQSEDSAKSWLRFWLVADISGAAFSDSIM
ncbi:expressed conserved protein [Echinococcus multilocularis]|uniref:Expressed conserved protein n=1 Tax=Echinococcus multilocularis TaxID=6211 RepID=A0A0S4MIA5_ECHMU|nr:expressed conserved protein [Echinococcus multilocularis]